MNQKDLEITRQTNRYKLETTSACHRNCVRINTANSMPHELAKLRAAYILRKHGKSFVCEAVFERTRARADIYVLDDDVAIEIVHSEDVKKATKRTRYPCRIVYHNAEEVFEMEEIL